MNIENNFIKKAPSENEAPFLFLINLTKLLLTPQPR